MIASAGVVTLGLSVSARSADFSLIPAATPPAAAAPTTPLEARGGALPAWTGFYLGGHAGYMAANSKWTTSGIGAAGLLQSGSTDIFDRDGPWGPMTGGFQGGYNYLFPSHFMLGIETDISFPNHLSATPTFSSPATGQFGITDTVKLFSTVRARAGYVFGNWLVYGTGGFAFDRDLLQNTQEAGMSAGLAVLPGNVNQAYFSRYGWTLGLGVELGLSKNWSAKLEYDLWISGRRTCGFRLRHSNLPLTWRSNRSRRV